MSPEALDLQWLEIRRALAAQLLKSNSEIHHTANSDVALVELKTAELELRVALLKRQCFQTGLLILIREWLRCGFSRLLLWGTNGGTSVARLGGIAAIIVPLYAILLSFSSVEFRMRPAGCPLCPGNPLSNN